jgi:broad specificity phosphatase PhoE
MPTYLHFFRHGQVAENRLHCLCGSSIDPPLTPTGIHQAMTCSETIDKIPHRISAIYCSPLLRARQTAEIATSFLFGMPLITEDTRLIERDFGKIDGKLSLIKLAKVWSYNYSYSTSNYGEETLLQMELRVKSFLTMVHDRHPDQHVVIFSHGGIGTAIYALLNEPHEHKGNYFKHFHLSNGEYASFLLD